MNKFLPALALAAVALPFQTALANDFEYPYVGVSYGQGELSDFCDGLDGISDNTDDVLACSSDDDANFFRIYSGARLLPNFGSEVGYTRTQRFGVSEYNQQMQSIDVTGNFFIPFGQRADVFVKAGVLAWRVRTDADEAGLIDQGLSADSIGNLVARDGTEHGFDFTTGLGARFGLTDLISLRADYTYIPNFGSSDIGLEEDLHKVSAGLQLHF